MMNSYEWQETLAIWHCRTRYERIAALIFVAGILGFLLWHFFYEATPEYSLEQLRTAMASKNPNAITTYCDLDSITSHAYDDLTRDMFAQDKNLSDKTKVMFEQFYVKIKPQVVAESNKLFLSYVQYGAWQPPEADNILKGRQLGMDYEYLIERSQLRNTQFEKIEDVQRSGDTAHAKVKVRDMYTNTTFVLELYMENQDGTWKVMRIVNYRDYLDFLAPIQADGLKAYVAATQDVIDKYNDILDTQQTHFKKLNETIDGILSSKQRRQLIEYVKSDIIPALQKRQAELDAIPLIDGGQYLSQLRHQETEISINSWQHFIEGIANDDHAALNTAHALHKEVDDIEYRIDDLFKNTAITGIKKTIP